MLSQNQQALLQQLEILFVQLESLYTPQQLENFHNMWFTLNPHNDDLDHGQLQRSIERQRKFRATQHHNGI